MPLVLPRCWPGRGATAEIGRPAKPQTALVYDECHVAIVSFARLQRLRSGLNYRGLVVANQELQIVPDSAFRHKPAWAVGGQLLWWRQPLGCVSGTGLLLSASTFFIGMLQALMSSTLISPVDVFGLLIMGLICFIPFGLFVRGVLKSQPGLAEIFKQLILVKRFTPQSNFGESK